MINKKLLLETEEQFKDLFLKKKILSGFHLSGGNEDQLIEIFKNVKENDWVFSTHRSHYHALLKGMSADKLIDKALNGKSMHIYDKKLKVFTSSIVGGTLPIALGVAMANKLKQSNDKVWAFVGDMCATMGVFHECLKYAEGHDLPIIFVIEDNEYCVDTKTKESWGMMNKTNKIISYKYKRIYPHAGTGDWIDLSDI